MGENISTKGKPIRCKGNSLGILWNFFFFAWYELCFLNFLVSVWKWFVNVQYVYYIAAVSRAPIAPLVMEEIMVAPPMPREVRIKVICSSLCHTDIGLWVLKVVFSNHIYSLNFYFHEHNKFLKICWHSCFFFFFFWFEGFAWNISKSFRSRSYWVSFTLVLWYAIFWGLLQWFPTQFLLCVVGLWKVLGRVFMK